jgi:hypothetical protein
METEFRSLPTYFVLRHTVYIDLYTSQCALMISQIQTVYYYNSSHAPML